MHHVDGEETAALNAEKAESIGDWLQFFFDQDLGEGHLEHFTQAPDQVDCIDFAAIPVILFGQSFIVSSDLTEAEDIFFITYNDSPPDEPLRSDSPLRAPPTRA